MHQWQSGKSGTISPPRYIGTTTAKVKGKVACIDSRHSRY